MMAEARAIGDGPIARRQAGGHFGQIRAHAVARGLHREQTLGFGGQTFAGNSDCISSGTTARPAIKFTIE